MGPLLKGRAALRKGASAGRGVPGSNPMRQATTILSFRTGGRGFLDATQPVSAWVEAQGMEEGLLTLFIRHTSASILVQENADPDVLADLGQALDRLAPRTHP